MTELFPVTAGVVVGLAIWRIGQPWLRWAVLIVAALVLGVVASLISGETELGLGFIPVDVAEVLGVSFLTAVTVAGWQRRPAALRQPIERDRAPRK